MSTGREYMSNRHFKSHPEAGDELDAYYWHRAVFQPRTPRNGAKFDLYHWALHYEQLARKRHGCDVSLNNVLEELAVVWEKFGGPEGLTLAQAQEAVTNSWQRSDELTADTIANQQGFKSPPTFTERGNLVPRNVDESNA
jgi:hypothetical protein